MDASCGPSNALSSLLKHTQQDHSLQNEFLGRHQQQNNVRNFKTGPGIDKQLNREFTNFNGGDFALSFMNSNPSFQQQHIQVQQQQIQHQAQSQQHHQQVQHAQSQQQHQHQGQTQHQRQDGQWVQDFSNISLQNTHQVNKQVGDWQQQFMSLPHMQIPMTAQPMMYRSQLAQAQVPSAMTEHKEVHKLEEERQMYEDQFTQLERELQSESVNEAQMELNVDKEEFAKAARQVQDSLLSVNNDEIADKILNSQFLKLMSSISNRLVELEGDKLVDTKSGHDIRESLAPHMSDPLRDVKQENEPSYHRPMHFPVQLSLPSHQGTSRDTVNALHLPDPLAHLKDGDLSGIESSLAAAQIISGNQVQSNDWMEDETWMDMTTTRVPPPRVGRKNNIMPEAWQEVYDDYRNDDDSH